MSIFTPPFIVEDYWEDTSVPFEECEFEILCPVEYISNYGPVDDKLLFRVRDFAKDPTKLGHMQLDDFDFDGWLERFKPPNLHILEYFNPGWRRWIDATPYEQPRLRPIDIREAFELVSETKRVADGCFIFRYNKPESSFNEQVHVTICNAVERDVWKCLGECTIEIDNLIHPERSEELLIERDVASPFYKKWLSGGGRRMMHYLDLDWNSWHSTYLLERQRFHPKRHLLQYKLEANGEIPETFTTMADDSWDEWRRTIFRMEDNGITNFRFCFRIIRNAMNTTIPGQVQVKQNLAATSGKDLSKYIFQINLTKSGESDRDRFRDRRPIDLATEEYKESLAQDPLRPITFQDLSWTAWINQLSTFFAPPPEKNSPKKTYTVENMDDYWLCYLDSTTRKPTYIDCNSEQAWRHALHAMASISIVTSEYRLMFDFYPRNDGSLGARNTSKKPPSKGNNGSNRKRAREAESDPEGGPNKSRAKLLTSGKARKSRKPVNSSDPTPYDSDDISGDDSFSDATDEDEEIELDEFGQPKDVSLTIEQRALMTDTINCEQFDEGTWRKCCEFFHADASNHDPAKKIKIRGISREIYPFQLYAVYWMLLQERGLANGGFLCDEQGLGKTTEAILLCIVNRMLIEAKEAISKKKPDDLNHLPKDQQKEGMDGKCPSDSRGEPEFGIACPCSPSSPSFNLEPKPGVSLILSPLPVLSAWRAEFNDIIDKDNDGENYFGMKIHVGHGNSEYPENKTLFWGLAIKDYSKVIIVTTSGSFETHVHHKWDQPDSDPPKVSQQSERGLSVKEKNKMRTQVELQQEELQDWKTNQGGKRFLIWSRIIRDESHQAKAASTQTLRFMRTLPGKAKNRNPFLWALTGTPWEVSPADLGAYINVFEKRATSRWPRSRQDDDKLDGFRYARKNEFDSLVKLHRELVDLAKTKGQTKVQREKFADKFGKVLRALMIRRTTDSTWYGAPIVELKPNFHKDIGCEPIAEYVEDLNMERDNTQAGLRAQIAKQQARASTQKVAIRRGIDTLRKAITTPYIARIRREMAEKKRERFDWALTADELGTEGWYDEGAESPYTTYLDDLVASSAKFATIQQSLLQPKKKDVDGKPAKLIIMTCFPAMAFITYLWLKKIGQKPILVSSKTPKRTQLIEGFQGLLHDNGKPKHEEASKARVLVTTPALCGTGLTITRAFRMILLEPQWLKRDQAQAFSRIIRISQRNPKTYTYLLYNRRDPTEAFIRKRQKRRGELTDAAFVDALNPNNDPEAQQNEGYSQLDDMIGNFEDGLELDGNDAPDLGQTAVEEDSEDGVSEESEVDYSQWV